MKLGISVCLWGRWRLLLPGLELLLALKVPLFVGSVPVCWVGEPWEGSWLKFLGHERWYHCWCGLEAIAVELWETFVVKPGDVGLGLIH